MFLALAKDLYKISNTGYILNQLRSHATQLQLLTFQMRLETGSWDWNLGGWVSCALIGGGCSVNNKTAGKLLLILWTPKRGVRILQTPTIQQPRASHKTVVVFLWICWFCERDWQENWGSNTIYVRQISDCYSETQAFWTGQESFYERSQRRSGDKCTPCR